MGFVVGVDVGGTAAKIAVFDEEGTMLGSSQVRTRLEDGGKHILPDISREVRALLSGLGIGLDELLGVGVGVPGPVVDGRTAVRCVNLGWGETDVAGFLELELGCRCALGTMLTSRLWAKPGKAPPGDPFSVMITLGTGVGGGVIINDRIVTGFHGGAGEIGHSPIQPGVGGPAAAATPTAWRSWRQRPGWPRATWKGPAGISAARRSLTRRREANLRR